MAVFLQECFLNEPELTRGVHEAAWRYQRNQLRQMKYGTNTDSNCL